MSLNLGEVMVRVGADLGPFKAAMQGAQGSTKELGAHLEKTSGAFKLLELAADAAAAVGLAEFAKKSLEMAVEGERTMARVKVAFGEGSKAAMDWAKSMHESTGISVDSLLNVRSNLQGFAMSLTNNADVAAKMSEDMAPLAMNISKIFGVDALQAAEALRSGLMGNARALGEYGIAMNATALKEYMHSKGIRGNITDLSEAQQTVLRYNFIMDHTTEIQKTAAEATATFGNKVSLLKGGVGDLAQSFGEALIPILSPMLDAVRGIVGAIKEWIEHHKKLTGTIGELVLGLAAVATAIGAIALLVTPLFALSLPLVGILALVAALGAAAVYFYETWKKNLYGVRGWVDNLKDGFKDFFGWIASNVKGVVADFVGPMLLAFKLIKQGLQDAKGGAGTSGSAMYGPPDSAYTPLPFADMAKDASSFVDGTKKAMLDMVSVLGDGFKDLGKGFSDTIDSMLSKAAKLGKGAPKINTEMFGPPELKDAAWMKKRPGVNDVPEIPKDFGTAAAAAGESLLSAVPALHDLTSAAAQGAQLGGVWGAVISVFGQLLSKSESFKKIVDLVTKMVQSLADALNPVADGILAIVQALAPLMDAVTQLLSGVTTDLVPVFSALAAAVGAIAIALVPLIELFGPLLAPIIRALADALTGAAFVIIATVIVIAYTWNAILDVVAKVITDLAVVVGAFSKDAAKAMTEFAGTLTKSTMDTVGIEDAWKKLLNPTAAELEAKKKARADAKAADAANQFADSAQSAAKAADSLTNVPTGFKIAMARFASTMGIATPGYSGGGVPDIGSKNPGDAGGLHQTVMTGDVHVTIQTNDPDAAWKGIKKAMQRDSFLKTGAGIMSAPRLVGG